jgi:hypothetical protein
LERLEVDSSWYDEDNHSRAQGSTSQQELEALTSFSALYAMSLQQQAAADYVVWAQQQQRRMSPAAAAVRYESSMSEVSHSCVVI